MGNKLLQCLPLKFDCFLTGIEIHVDKRVDLGVWFSWSYFFFMELSFCFVKLSRQPFPRNTM